MNLKNAIVNKVSTLKDRSVKIELITRELDTKELAELFFSVNNEVASVDIPEETGEIKSKSQRLRGVLYKVWETNNELKQKYKTFSLFYDSVMEQIIEHYKEKIIS